MKRKYKRRFAAIIVLAFNLLIAAGQNINPVSDFLPPSPNASSIAVWAKSNINMAIGAPAINIPLYTVVEGEIIVPIELNYNSTGLHPNERTSWVGMGWSLNAGGVITREMNQIPDEAMNPVKTGFFFKSWAQKPLIDYYNEHGTYYLTGNNIDPANQTEFTTWDAEPDMFYFNFGNYSGKFFCKNKEHENDPVEFVTVPNYNFKIEYTTETCETKTINSITITTDEGYRYIFGNSMNEFYPINIPARYADGYGAVEYTQPVGNSSIYPLAVSWYLKTIISPTYDSVNFEYTSYDPDNKEYIIYSKYYSESTFSGRWNLCEDCPLKIYGGKKIKFLADFSSSGGSCSEITTDLITVNYRTYLKSITTSNKKINFYFSDYDYTQFNYPCGSSDNPKEQKLDSVTIMLKSTNQNFKTFLFDYDDPRWRLTLRTLTESDGKTELPYKFTYKNQYLMPTYFTDFYDHWNYFNARYDRVPCQNEDNGFAPLFINIDGETVRQPRHPRDPNINFVDVGMIQKIDYPTGGSTTYEFEPNTYNQYLLRTDCSGLPCSSQFGCFTENTGFYRYKIDSIGIAGGVRVKRITDDPGDGSMPLVRDYEYYDGVLSDLPIYAVGASGRLPWADDVPTSSAYWQLSSTNPLNRFGSTFGNAMGYSKVVEMKSDGSRIEYNYTNFDTKPDLLVTMGRLSNTYPICSRDIERGILKEIKYYNSSDQIQKRIVYNYRAFDQMGSSNENENSFLNTKFPNIDYSERANHSVACLISGQEDASSEESSWWSYYYVFFYSNKLIDDSTFTYFNNGANCVIETNHYLYKNNKTERLYTKTFKNVDGIDYKTVYHYPGDEPTISPNKELISKNITGVVIQQDQIASTGNLMTGSTKTVYDQTNCLPKSVMNYNTETKNYEPVIYFDKYDDKGNLLQFHKPYQDTISFIWAYNKQHVVAKVENIVYSKIVTDFTSDANFKISLIEKTSNPTTLEGFFTSLRSKYSGDSYKEVMISTYQYDPRFDAVTKITDEKELYTTYSYDDYGRLINVKDFNGNILKSYDYFYKTEVPKLTNYNLSYTGLPILHPQNINQVSICRITDSIGNNITSNVIVPETKYRIYWESSYKELDGYILYLADYYNYTICFEVSNMSAFTKGYYFEWTPSCSDLYRVGRDFTNNHFVMIIKNVYNEEILGIPPAIYYTPAPCPFP